MELVMLHVCIALVFHHTPQGSKNTTFESNETGQLRRKSPYLWSFALIACRSDLLKGTFIITNIGGFWGFWSPNFNFCLKRKRKEKNSLFFF